MKDSDNQPPAWGGSQPEQIGQGLPLTPDGGEFTAPDLYPPVRNPGPWGVWATIGWMILMTASFILASLIAVVPFAAWVRLTGDPSRFQDTLANMVENGDFVWINYLVTLPVLGSVLALAILLRRGYSPLEYLALKNARPAGWVIWPLLLAGFSIGSDLFMSLIGVDPVADWMVDVFYSARCFSCLILAVVLIAPLLEELVFRGFVYTGIQARLGHFWAVIFSTAPWALMHLQYQEQWYFMVLIFVLGLLFAIARWRTNSVLVPVAMHMLQNALASVEMWLFT